ncbi:MAG: type IV toxin-antitoxin system AbiEi family antitoxin [Rothia sp. (in: high G+C Gram-positive bacteria)]|nr:type IV toxin-antitoxin system AbiEi family antitoxin [Rothia sp. (in: high G+C Gram-positive bacteria)]
MEQVHLLHQLSDLPFPLAPGRGRKNALEQLAREHGQLPQSPRLPLPQLAWPPGPDGQILPYPLYTQFELGLSNQAWGKFIEKHRLLELHNGIYYPSHYPLTSLHKAQSLALALPELYLHRCRFSRLSAAWVLGYSPLAPQEGIHLDYSRSRRLHIPKVLAPRLKAHCSNLKNPYETMSLGPIRLTTPLKTAVDLIRFHESTEHLEAVLAILEDPGNLVTPALFLKHLQEQSSLPKASLLRARHLADLASSRLTHF